MYGSLPPASPGYEVYPRPGATAAHSQQGVHTLYKLSLAETSEQLFLGERSGNEDGENPFEIGVLAWWQEFLKAGAGS